MELPHVVSEMSVCCAFPPTHVLIEHLRDDSTLNQAFFQIITVPVLAESARLTCNASTHEA